MTGPTQPLLRLPLATAFAVLAGLLLWLGFPPVGFGLAAIPGVALLTAALWGARVRRGLGLGALTGGVLFALLLEWMRVTGAVTALVTRLPLAPIWVGCAWVLGEGLRARIPLGGFPWGNLSYAQADTSLGDWAALGGAAWVTFVVATLGALLVAVARAAGTGDRRTVVGWSVAAAVLVVVPWFARPAITGDTDGGEATATVALVQGGTPQMGMGAMDVRRAVLDNHVRQTLDLAEAIAAGEVPQPQFVLWPENSSDLDPFADPTVAADITAAARAVGVPILVGAVTAVPGDPMGVWNVGIVWDPEAGPTQMYIKTHPVPFGEYVPFREQLAGLIGRFERVPRDFRAGTEPGNLEVAGVAVGNVICFEIAYREVVDAVVEGGARLVTVQTNNATYGGTSQPAQQLAITRLRATEFGRSVLVAATSGISAVILPDRSVTQSLPVGSEGWIVAEVPLRGATTPATRIGTPLELLLVLAVSGAVVVAVRRARVKA
jgi:apolipoprotein N-acyltransferase